MEFCQAIDNRLHFAERLAEANNTQIKTFASINMDYIPRHQYEALPASQRKLFYPLLSLVSTNGSPERAFLNIETGEEVEFCEFLDMELSEDERAKYIRILYFSET